MRPGRSFPSSGMIRRRGAGYSKFRPDENENTTAAMAAFNSAPADGSSARRLYDVLITGLITTGLFTKLDWLCVAGAGTTDEHDFRVNLVNPAKALTAVSSPTYTTASGNGVGFSFDGATQYLHLNEAPNAAGNVFALNSAHVGVYCNNAGSTGSRVQVGPTSGSVTQIVASSSSSGSIRMNDANSLVLPTPSPASRLGHRIISRTASNVRVAYLNGTSVANDTEVSTSVPGSLAWPRVAASYGIDRFGAVHCGSGLDSTDVTNITNLVSAYLTGIGAN